MNQETNDFLNENLEEAHNTFNSIIKEMKQNNISINYQELEEREIKCYYEIKEIMNEMNCFVHNTNIIKENNKELFNYKYNLYLKYLSLYIVSLVFISLYHKIFDTSKLHDIVKYFVGMFLGSTYMGLLKKDISDNLSDTKEKRDLINQLKTMKEEYKKDHDTVVCEINGMFGINDILWDRLDKVKEKNNTSVTYKKIL